MTCALLCHNKLRRTTGSKKHNRKYRSGPKSSLHYSRVQQRFLVNKTSFSNEVTLKTNNLSFSVGEHYIVHMEEFRTAAPTFEKQMCDQGEFFKCPLCRPGEPEAGSGGRPALCRFYHWQGPLLFGRIRLD